MEDRRGGSGAQISSKHTSDGGGGGGLGVHRFRRSTHQMEEDSGWNIARHTKRTGGG